MNGGKLQLMGKRAILFQSSLHIDETLISRNLVDIGGPLVVISNPAFGN